MKLNPDCIRDILITVEEIEYNSTYTIQQFHDQLPKYSIEELNYHCLHLINAGLIQGDILSVVRSVMPEVGRIYDMTYAGHQFLANIRSDNIWKGTKAIASKIGSSSLDAITQIASNVITELIKAQFGLI